MLAGRKRQRGFELFRRADQNVELGDSVVRAGHAVALRRHDFRRGESSARSRLALPAIVPRLAAGAG